MDVAQEVVGGQAPGEELAHGCASFVLVVGDEDGPLDRWERGGQRVLDDATVEEGAERLAVADGGIGEVRDAVVDERVLSVDDVGEGLVLEAGGEVGGAAEGVVVVGLELLVDAGLVESPLLNEAKKEV